MAIINSKVIFVTTSPRTPAKMIPEIELLHTHLEGQVLKKETNKPAYCLFIAPNINEACIAHFYTLHKTNISYYGGFSTIIPLPLSVFVKMLEDSHNANYIPEPKHIRRFFECSNELVNTTNNEVDWYNEVTRRALNWLEV